jgi:hypothetical protein
MEDNGQLYSSHYTLGEETWTGQRVSFTVSVNAMMRKIHVLVMQLIASPNWLSYPSLQLMSDVFEIYSQDNRIFDIT